MRLVLALILFALLTGTGAAPSHPEAAPHHSASVVAATHEPVQPARGQDVHIEVTLAPNTSVAKVTAIYCRVERYACGPSLTAKPAGDGTYGTTIPWHPAFFDGARQVGYQFEVRHANGTLETTPLEHYPERPARLPEAGGVYYYYGLPAEAPGPSLIPLLVGVAVLVGLGSRRR